jgi:hypothetical protein
VDLVAEWPRGEIYPQTTTAWEAKVWERVRQTVLRQPLLVEIAPGELLDKFTILEIKRSRIRDRVKLMNVQVELDALRATQARVLAEFAELTAPIAELRRVNERLWDVEDALRQCERDSDFGSRFIELARSVYQFNDLRAQLKRRINELCGSVLIEEKSYCSAGESEAPSVLEEDEVMR